MALRTIGKSQLAKQLGITKQAVDQASKRSLREAVVHGRINLDSPAAIKYISRKRQTKIPDSPQSTVPTYDLDLSLHQIAHKYGCEEGMEIYLKLVKLIVSITSKEISNQETRSRLVPTNFVVNHILKPIDHGCEVLLKTAPKQIAVGTTKIFNEGGTPEEGELYVAQIISEHLSATKSEALKAIFGESARSVEIRTDNLVRL